MKAKQNIDEIIIDSIMECKLTDLALMSIEQHTHLEIKPAVFENENIFLQFIEALIGKLIWIPLAKKYYANEVENRLKEFKSDEYAPTGTHLDPLPGREMGFGIYVPFVSIVKYRCPDLYEKYGVLLK